MFGVIYLARILNRGTNVHQVGIDQGRIGTDLDYRKHNFSSEAQKALDTRQLPAIAVLLHDLARLQHMQGIHGTQFTRSDNSSTAVSCVPQTAVTPAPHSLASCTSA